MVESESNLIENIIICSPYMKPNKHYVWNQDDNKYDLKNGRRLAGYQTMKSNGNYGPHISIDSVNIIRPRVDEWRKENYKGVSDVTKELLRHWSDKDRQKQLFFCQLEAIETIIYLTEVQPDLKIPGFEKGVEDFTRLCTKMATGTGKTIVMGMLIVWQVLNKTDDKHVQNILIVTPSITVKTRLEDLKPESSTNVYTDFHLIPYKLQDKFKGNANIIVTNFHQLVKKPYKGINNIPSKAGKIINIPEESDQGLVYRIFKKETPNNILVINDEGHHAYILDKKELKTDRESKQDATNAGIWMDGLKMINNACKIIKCHDFSATPFIPTGKASIEKMLFKWIISDFSLADAIESGLVKTPQAPLMFNNNDDYRHLYANKEIQYVLNGNKKGGNKGKNGKFHHILQHAYKTLGDDWKKTYDLWKSNNSPIPPVFITICNSTNNSKTVINEFTSIGLPSELFTKDAMIRIDSEIIKEGGRNPEKENKLREKINTVGKQGKSGEKICNIISVNMLTEGWDARNVTHIMGLRAFSSQLLCEQVVGRGLRRMSYETENGLFKPEYVTILGVPFGMFPVKTGKIKSPKPQRLVTKSNKDTHKIAWAEIKNINKRFIKEFNIDASSLLSFKLNDVLYNNGIKLAPIVDGFPFVTSKILSHGSIHRQHVMFVILAFMMKQRIDKYVKDDSLELENANKYNIVLDALSIIESFLLTRIESSLDDEKRNVVLLIQSKEIATHILKQLSVPIKKKYFEINSKETNSTRNFKDKYTSAVKDLYEDCKKSHIIPAVCANDFENKICKYLDNNQNVLSWVKADYAGFYINYEDVEGTGREYRPDFIIHLKNGVQLVLEGKGEKRDYKIKQDALDVWVNAVNNHGEFGIWDHDVLFYEKDKWERELSEIINKKRYYSCIRKCKKCKIEVKDVYKGTKIFGFANNLSGLLIINNHICKKCFKLIKS